MKVATKAEITEIDKRAIEEYGIPGMVLMENAGCETVRQMERILGALPGKKIMVFAGKGNNGGDGYVIARHLHNHGAKIKVFLIGNKAAVTGDAQQHLQIISRMGIEVAEVTDEQEWHKVKIAMMFSDCLIDALLGTGFSGELSGYMADVVDSINKINKPVIAVDIPSGVDADTGQVRGSAVKATHTVTFSLPKPGLLLYPGAGCAGEVTVADIGIPRDMLTASSIKQNLITQEMIEELLLTRPADAHKGSCGKVLVIGGSKGLTGAAALSAEAALRTGAGLVTLGAAASLHDVLAAKLTEVMNAPLSEVADGVIGQGAVSEIDELARRSDVVALGPGLGRHHDTMTTVRCLIKNIEKPLVLDADALYALEGHTNLLSDAPGIPVLTPHPGEMARLVGMTADEVNEDRLYIARQAAMEWGSIVVLKGARTVVAFPDGEVYINIKGNAGMATGGCGDVLTGVIAALIGQGMSSHEAALAGVYLHGLAGDIVAKHGMVGMTAGDVCRALPAAIFAIKGSGEA